MSVINFINKLSSEVKKVSEEHYFTEEELRKQKNSFKLLSTFNNNTIGYKNKYLFEIDEEYKNDVNFYAVEIIFNYLLELFIQSNDISFFKYEFYIYENNLHLSLFHTQKNYLEEVSKNIINFFSIESNNLSLKIKNKFIDFSILPFKSKIKFIQKEFPLIIDILCNLINDKQLNDKSNEITDSIIRFIITNDINIIKLGDIKISTLKSQENPIEFLDNKRKNDNKIPLKTKKFKNESNEIINDNIKHLFWHTIERKNELIKTDWMNSAVFLTVVAVVSYIFPNYLQKFLDLKKSNSVIDNILDTATEDLTTVNNKKSEKIISDNEIEKILKNEMIDDLPDFNLSSKENTRSNLDFESITRNILNKLSNSDVTNSSVEIKNIENRLKDILEETNT